MRVFTIGTPTAKILRAPVWKPTRTGCSKNDKPSSIFESKRVLSDNGLPSLGRSLGEIDGRDKSECRFAIWGVTWPFASDRRITDFKVEHQYLNSQEAPTPMARPLIVSCSRELTRDFTRLYTDYTQQGIPKSMGRLCATLDVHPREWLHASIFGHQSIRPRDVHLRGRVSADITATWLPTEDG